MRSATRPAPRDVGPAFNLRGPTGCAMPRQYAASAAAYAAALANGARAQPIFATIRTICPKDSGRTGEAEAVLIRTKHTSGKKLRLLLCPRTRHPSAAGVAMPEVCRGNTTTAVAAYPAARAEAAPENCRGVAASCSSRLRRAPWNYPARLFSKLSVRTSQPGYRAIIGRV